MERKILSFKELHDLHRRLWGWLAENPLMNKEDWPEWYYNKGIVGEATCDCFACSYDDNVSYLKIKQPNCEHCPIKWSNARVTSKGDERPFCNIRGSEYFEWSICEDVQERSRLANVIKNMPWINKE